MEGIVRVLIAAGAARPEPNVSPTVVGRYRTTRSNLAIVAGFAVAAWTVAGDLTGPGGGGPMWSWRAPVAAAIGGAMSLRAWRRGVIITTAGIEGRRLWSSWRVPWSAIEVCGITDPVRGPQPQHGELMVTMLDGRTRRAPVGRGRRHDPSVDVALAAPQEGGPVSSSEYRDPNRPLAACLASAIGLLTAMAVAETGRMNQELTRRGVVSYDAERWRELGVEIAVARTLAIVLAVAVTVLGGLAIVDAFRRRTAPQHRWPAGLDFPTVGTHVFDQQASLTVSGNRIWAEDGELVAVVSARRIPWTTTTVRTYWTARGVSDFSVHHVGDRWHLTSWRSPLDAWLEGDPRHGSTLSLYVGGQRVGRLWEDHARPGLPRRYMVLDDANRPIGALGRIGTMWTCSMPEATSPTVRRLLCVAVEWAGLRFAHLRSGD